MIVDSDEVVRGGSVLSVPHEKKNDHVCDHNSRKEDGVGDVDDLQPSSTTTTTTTLKTTTTINKIERTLKNEKKRWQIDDLYVAQLLHQM